MRQAQIGIGLIIVLFSTACGSEGGLTAETHTVPTSPPSGSQVAVETGDETSTSSSNAATSRGREVADATPAATSEFRDGQGAGDSGPTEAMELAGRLDPETPACSYIKLEQVKKLLPALEPLLTDPSAWNYPDCLFNVAGEPYQLHLQLIVGGVNGDPEIFLDSTQQRIDAANQQLGFNETFAPVVGLGPGAFVSSSEPIPGKQNAVTTVHWVYGDTDAQLSFIVDVGDPSFTSGTDLTPISEEGLLTLAKQTTMNFAQ